MFALTHFLVPVAAPTYVLLYVVRLRHTLLLSHGLQSLPLVLLIHHLFLTDTLQFLLEEGHHGVLLLHHGAVHHGGYWVAQEPRMLDQLVKLGSFARVLVKHDFDQRFAGVTHGVGGVLGELKLAGDDEVLGVAPAVGVEGEAAEDKAVEENAEGPDVEAGVGLEAELGEQLGWTVPEGACFVLVKGQLELACNAEVYDFDASRESVCFLKHYVLQFNVSVHYALFMAVLYSHSDLYHQTRSLLFTYVSLPTLL